MQCPPSVRLTLCLVHERPAWALQKLWDSQRQPKRHIVCQNHWVHGGQAMQGRQTKCQATRDTPAWPPSPEGRGRGRSGRDTTTSIQGIPSGKADVETCLKITILRLVSSFVVDFSADSSPARDWHDCLIHSARNHGSLGRSGWRSSPVTRPRTGRPVRKTEEDVLGWEERASGPERSKVWRKMASEQKPKTTERGESTQQTTSGKQLPIPEHTSWFSSRLKARARSPSALANKLLHEITTELIPSGTNMSAEKCGV